MGLDEDDRCSGGTVQNEENGEIIRVIYVAIGLGRHTFLATGFIFERSRNVIGCNGGIPPFHCSFHTDCAT